MTGWRSRASSTGRMYRAEMPDGREVAVEVGPRRRGKPVPAGKQPAQRGSLTAGLSFGAASFLGNTTVALFTSVFIARLYGVNVVGEFALVYAPVAAVTLLSTVREQPALQREVALLPPRHPRSTGLFMAVFAFSTGLTVVVAAIGVLVTYFLFHGPINQPALFMPALVSMAGYTVFTNTCMNLDSIFIAYRDGRQLFVLRLHQAVLYLVLVVACRFVSGSVWSLVFTMIISWAIPCLHRAIVLRRWLTLRISREEVRSGFAALPQMLKFGLKLTPTGLLGGASDQIATWVLGSVSTVADVGAYNRAWSVGQRFLEARLRLSELLFPSLVERRHERDTDGFNRALIDSLRYGTAFLLLFASAGGGAAAGIMTLFGVGFERAAPGLVFLLLVPAFTAMVFLASQALIAADRALEITISAVVRLVVTLTAVIALGSRFGITGAAIGMALGAAVQVLCQFFVVQRELLRMLPVWWPRRQMIGQLAAYAAGFVAARSILGTVPGYLGVAVALLGGVIAYVAVLVLGGGLLARDRVRLERVLGRLTVRRASSAPAMPAPILLRDEESTLSAPPVAPGNWK